MDHWVQEHVKLTTDDFCNINKIISNYKSEHLNISISQALNEEIGKVLVRPENQGKNVTHETFFQIPPDTGIESPLFVAVSQGCMESLLYFLTRFGDAIDFASATELNANESFCTPKMVDDLNEFHYVHGNSILSAACSINNPDRCLEVVEILVSRGALVNSCNCYGQTPLMEAAGTENLEVLKYLVEQGAIIDAYDKGGCTALFYAATSKRNSVNDIKYLVSKGANIAHCSMFGYTALHFAAREGNVETVKELLALGASPEFVHANSSKPSYVPPPLLLAASKKHRVVVDVFLEHPDCTPELRVDALLLLGICASDVDSIEPLWREAITLREKCLPSTQFLPPLEAFGGRTEMRTTAELDAVLSSEAEELYQCFIINERCFGVLEPDALILSIGEYFAGEFLSHSEAEILMKHALNRWLSLLHHLPSDMRGYELNHSLSLLSLASIAVNVTIPEIVESTGGKEPNIKPFIEFSQRCLEFMVDASQSQSCMESDSISHIVSSTLKTFSFWYDQQVLRKANNPTDMTRMVPDEEYKTCLQQFVSTCFRHSQYVALVHDAMSCSGKLSADVVRTMLECGGDCYINSFDKCGRRPLHVAVQSGKPELVSLLLEFGAHLDAVNSEGSTAAEVVCHKNTDSIQQVFSDFLPLPLTCLASQAIVAAKIRYETLDLPLHIKNCIKLHDSQA